MYVKWQAQQSFRQMYHQELRFEICKLYPETHLDSILTQLGFYELFRWKAFVAGGRDESVPERNGTFQFPILSGTETIIVGTILDIMSLPSFLSCYFLLCACLSAFEVFSGPIFLNFTLFQKFCLYLSFSVCPMLEMRNPAKRYMRCCCQIGRVYVNLFMCNESSRL